MVRKDYYVPMDERDDPALNPRGYTRDGHYSPLRAALIEALDAFGKDGGTLQQVVDLLGDELEAANPNQSAGRALGWLTKLKVVTRIKDRYYLAEHAPELPQATKPAPKYAPILRPPHEQNGSVQISPFMAKRKGKRVALYIGHKILENVIGVSLLIGNEWRRVPLWMESARVMIGENRPEWHPEQETWDHVEMVRFVFKSGAIEEHRPNPRELVTIAPEE